MPSQSETGDVGARMHVAFQHGLGGRAIELHHAVDDRAQVLVGAQLRPQGGVHDARAERFRVVQRIAGQRPAVSHHALRVHQAEHGKAVFGLVVFDGVAAYHERPGLAHLVRAAAQHIAHHFGAHAAGEGQDVERGDGSSAHSEHVGQGVCRGHGSELVRVVHHRREEVERQHGGVVLIHLPNRGIVCGVEAQQQVRVGHGRRDVAQYLGEVSRTPFRRSTAFVGERGQAYAIAVA